MRTKLYMITLAAMTMILALSGCSESEDLLSAFHSDPNAVRITAQVGKASADGFTRSYPLGDAEEQTKFKEDDEISVQADGQDAVTYKYDGKEWVPQGSKFLKWENKTMNFTAYYPSTFNGTITQPTEYTSVESLAAADFMSFSGPQTKTEDNNNQLTITMNRQMARVVVDITGFNDQYAGATIDNVSSLSICGVKAYKHNDGKFYALIKPCAAQSSETFISLDVAEGESKTTETLTGIPALVAGNSYTYHLTVGKSKVTIGDVTVADWLTGAILKGTTDVKDKTPYVTFSAPAEQTFKMVCYGGYEISNLEYSVNFGDWKEVKDGEGVTFGGKNGGLRLRGKNVKGTADPNDTRIYSTITFIFDKNKEDKVNTNVMVECTGDIRTLLDYKDYENVKTSEARFIKLFDHCEALTSAPKLPATDIASDCYNSMFNWCRYLKNAPELPATILKDQCYQNMFYACVSLTSAPKLPATKLAFNCYANMFSYCYWLKEAPELPATTLASQCYQDMFTNCSFNKAPKLPAEIMKSNCYAGMFAGCTNLTEAPELPAKQLESFCYSRMFQGCTKLSTVTMLAPSDKISKASNCCYNWLDKSGTDASSRTLKVMDADAYTALEGNGDLPDNWKKGATNTTVLNKDNGKIE